MRFIAVFNQQSDYHAVGFDDLTDAADFLLGGYADRQLTPCGTYDVLTGDIISDDAYESDHIADMNELIRRIARSYLVKALNRGRG